MVARRDILGSVAADATAWNTIPLDLAPLLAPYRQHQRLSLRVVQLPARAALTAGLRNDDASWSLLPDDLDGLALVLPDDVEPPRSIAVRIVVIDKNENASVVGQFEVPLPRPARAAVTPAAVPAAEWQRRLERRAAAAKRLAARKTARALAAAESRWRADSDARLAEVLEHERAVRAELEAAQARAAGAEAEVRQLQARLAQMAAQQEAESAAQHATERQGLELEWRQKLETERAARTAAEERAEAAARRAEALVAELAAARSTPVAVADPQRWAQQQVQEIEARLAAEAKARLVAARAAWRKESETQTAAAVSEAVHKAEAIAAARLREAREEWQRETQAALAAAEGQWRIETAKQLAAAQAEWRKAAEAKATVGRRKLRSVARRQAAGAGLRRVGRLAVVAAGVAAAVALAAHFRPATIEQWLPQVIALAGDATSSVLQHMPWPKAVKEAAGKAAGHVVTGTANLRVAPSTTAAVVAKLSRDTRVAVVERRGDWLRVRSDAEAREGWLHHSLLAPLRAQ